MGKPSPPPSPDYDRMMEISEMQMAQNEELFNDFMSFQEQAYADQKEVSDAVAGIMLPAMEAEAQFAQDQRERYQELGIPLEDDYLAQVEKYNDPAYQEERAAEASNTVAMSMEASREAELRRLEGYGLDPSQTRSAALDTRMETQGAVAQATAANNERRNAEATGLALQADAVNMMRGLPSQAAQSYATAQGAGGQAYGVTGATGAFGQQGYTTGAGILGQGASMNNMAWGNTTDAYNAEVNAYNIESQNSFGAGLGSLMGAALPAAGTAGGFGPLFGLKDGGWVPPEASPSRGAIPDDIPAALTGNEYVMDDNTVRWHGLKTMSKMQKEAHEGLGLPVGNGGQRK